MGLSSMIESLKKTIVPPSNRNGGGSFIQYVPYGAVGTTLTGHATAWKAYPAAAGILAATANLTDAWIEAVELSQASAAGTFAVALGYAGAVIPTVANNGLEGEVAAYLDVAGGTFLGPEAVVVPCNPPIHIPGGNLISGSVITSVANGTVVVRLILSRNKTHKP